MLKLSQASNQSVDARLRQSLRELRSARDIWNEAQAQQEHSTTELAEARERFDSSEAPIQRVTFDTPSRLSNWDGRDIDSAFRYGDQDLYESRAHLDEAQSSQEKLDGKMKSEEQSLQETLKRMKEAGDPRFAQVQQALGHLDQAELAFGETGEQWELASTAVAFTSIDILKADQDIRQVINDRPGRDVSEYGYRIQETLDGVHWDLSRMDYRFERSLAPSRQGEQSLLSSIEHLENCLS